MNTCSSPYYQICVPKGRANLFSTIRMGNAFLANMDLIVKKKKKKERNLCQ